jgi:hypothetical protein
MLVQLARRLQGRIDFHVIACRGLRGYLFTLDAFQML